MRYVREHINEKFTQESDPIRDLGIGSVISCRVGDIIKVKDKFTHVYLINEKDDDKKYSFSENNKHTNAWLYPHGLICVIKNIKRYKNTMSLTIDLKNPLADHSYNTISIEGAYDLFLKYFEKVK